MTLPLSLTLIFMALGPSADPPVVVWVGDVPRSALSVLLEARSGAAPADHFLFGALAGAQQLESLRTHLVDSPYGPLDWPAPAQPLDWHRHRLVYVAFDGATRMLALEDVRRTEDTWTELVYGARGARRRDSPEGPCSLLLWRAELPGDGRVRLIERAHDGGEVVLGELDLTAMAEPG